MIVRNISLYTSLIISFYIPYCICHGMEFIPCMTLCTFALIDTVYRDLTGPLVHMLRTLPTP